MSSRTASNMHERAREASLLIQDALQAAEREPNALEPSVEWFVTAFNSTAASVWEFEKVTPTVAFAAVYHEYELIPRARRLAQLALASYAGIRRRGGAAALTPEQRASLYDPDPLVHALWLVGVPLIIIMQGAAVLHGAGLREKPFGRLPAGAVRLLEALSADATTDALAGAVRLVVDEAWPRLAGLDEAAVMASPLTKPAASVMHVAARTLMLSAVTSPAVGRDGGPRSPAGVAAQKQLRALQRSGLIAAVAAAVHRAPHGPEVPAGATDIGVINRMLVDSSQLVWTVLFEIVMHITTWKEVTTQIVTSPEVLALRWAGLAQLTSFSADENAPATPPEAAALAAAAGPRWAILNRRVLALEFTQPLARRWIMLFIPTAIASVGLMPLADDASMLSRQIADGVAPSRETIVEYAASAARALVAEAEAVAAAGGVDAGPNAPVSAQFHAYMESLTNAFIASYQVLDRRSLAEGATLLPAIMETGGWLLCALASPAGVPGGWYEYANARKMVFHLAEMVKDWAQFPGPVRAAIARRLLPTGVLHSLDSLLRLGVVMGDVGITGAREILDPPAAILMALLEPLMRERVAGCRTGTPLPLRHKAQGGAPSISAALRPESAPAWHPQDELGLLVTFAKLTRREAAAALAELAAGRFVEERLLRLRLLCKPTFSSVEGLPRMPGLKAIVDILPAAAAGAPADAPGAAAAPDAAGASDPAAAAAATAERVRVAVLEAITLCACTALETLEAYCLCFAEHLRETAAAPGAVPSQMIARHRETCAWLPVAIGAVFNSLPPDELLAARPFRAMSWVGRLFMALPQRLQIPPMAEPFCNTATKLSEAIFAMGADPALTRHVARWMRDELPEEEVGSAAAPAMRAAEVAASIQHTELLWGRIVPVIVDAIARKPSLDEAEAELFRASEDSKPAREKQRWAPAARGLGGAPLWPPRVLRLCGYPGCFNTGSAVEADLKLSQCGGCRIVRYCSAECQRAHWRAGHKAECAGVAAAGKAATAAWRAGTRPAAAAAAARADTAGTAGPSATGVGAGGSADGSSSSGAGGAAPSGGWSAEALQAMRPRELKDILSSRGIPHADCVEKVDLVRRILERC